MDGKGPRIKRIPPGDQHERLVCPECAFVAYENPKLVNVAVPVHDGKILLCRRGIAPRKGYWTLPGGFMEIGETVQEGALRETQEEAHAEIIVGALLGIYHTPAKNHVMLVFRAEMPKPEADPGPESLEVRLFDWKDIPWNELAFPMVAEALKKYDETKHLTVFQPDIKVMPPIGTPPAPPSDAPKP